MMDSANRPQLDSTDLSSSQIDKDTATEQRSSGKFRRFGSGKINHGAVVAVLLVGGLGVGWAAGAFDGEEPEKSSMTKKKDAKASDNIEVDPLGGYTPEPELDLVENEGVEGVPSLNGQGQNLNAGGGNNGQAQEQRRQRIEAERKAAREAALAKRRSPVMVQSGVLKTNLSDSLSAINSPITAATGSNGQQTGISARIAVRSITKIKASRLSNRDFLVTAGTVIPCIMQTAIDTTQIGLVSCIISRNVLSQNGNVVLMEKGTKVLGQYTGGIQQGQARLFVSWNRAVTPKGVTIDLSSPAADPLGRSGLDGKTETFFWKRFGGSLLLSVLGDLSKIAASAVSSARETSNAPNQAASIALENSINIKPILKAAHGKEVTIFVANDLDFSPIYSLALTR